MEQQGWIKDGKGSQATEMSFADFLDYWMEHDCDAVLKESTFIKLCWTNIAVIRIVICA